MKDTRKLAKEILDAAPLPEYERILDLARLSKRQRFILSERYDEDRKNFQIAMDIDMSPETVRDELADIFDRVWKLKEKGYI